MHSLFAIEPEAINNWNDFRYVVEKFGYSKGLLIARYPKRWMAMVMEACRNNDLSDIELKKIEERLSQIKLDRLYKCGLEYESDQSWRANVARQEIFSCVDAVLVKDFDGSDKFHAVSDADEGLFNNRREYQVKRDASSLAKAATRLIRDSSSLILVDPYFRSSRECLKVLSEFVNLIIAEAKPEYELVVHVAHSKYPVSSELFISESTRHLSDYLDSKISVTIVRWSDQQLDFDFHARYLITSQGGLRYDRGFVEPADLEDREKVTDVTCMDDQIKLEIIEQFNNYKFSELVVDQFRVI